MASARQFAFAVLWSAVAVGCAGPAPPPPTTSTTAQPPATSPAPTAAPQTRVLERPTATITLPVSVVDGDVSEGSPDRLTIRAEKEDREAEGPQSFDVLPDGNIVVADPLRDRLLVFDRRGGAVQRIEVGVSARTVAVAGAGDALRIVPGSQGTPRIVDFNGAQIPDPSARGRTGGAIPPPPPPPQVTLDDGRRSGTIRWTARAFGAPPGEPAQNPDLQVQLAAAAGRLASVRVIAVDAQRRTYVSIEAMAGDGTPGSPLARMVRRYGPDGGLEIEIRSILNDYYIVPSTEFRVVRDALYQLLPHREAVLINVWDLTK
jgi:hypothetical protein